MDRAYIKEQSKRILGGSIFSSQWMTALLICMIMSVIIGLPSSLSSLPNFTTSLRAIMNGDVIDANALTYEGRENVVHYIVVSGEKKIVGNMNDGGYEEFARIDGYVIYKSTELDFFIPSELGFEVEELD